MDSPLMRIGNYADFLLWRDCPGGTVEIVDIAVGSDRRKGVGTAMVRRLQRLRPDAGIFAITRMTNEVAQQFYESLGFHVAGVLRRFYSADRGADAIMYLWRKPT